MNKENQESWGMIDENLKNLMSKNDELPDQELRAKSKRLAHLARFCKTLSKRVDERLQDGVKQGSISTLFDKYQTERKAVDFNA